MADKRVYEPCYFCGKTAKIVPGKLTICPEDEAKFPIWPVGDA